MASDRLQQWLEQQQLHWQKLVSGAIDAPTDWQSVLDSCAELAGQQSEQQADLTASMTRQVQGFNKYAERLLNAIHSGASDDIEQCLKALTDHLHQQAGEAFYRDWQPPEAFQQMTHQLGLSPSVFSSFPFLHQQFERRSSKHKKQFEQLEQVLRRFADAFNNYIELQQQVHKQTAEQLRQQLQAGEIESPQTLQQLQGLWIDCYEHCYRQRLLTSEYQQAYGELSNTLLELQRQTRHYWQDEYRAYGLVPYQDYDLLLKQQHKLRKSHRQAQRQINQLEQQLTDQQQRLERLEQLLQAEDAKHSSGTAS